MGKHVPSANCVNAASRGKDLSRGWIAGLNSRGLGIDGVGGFLERLAVGLEYLDGGEGAAIGC